MKIVKSKKIVSDNRKSAMNASGKSRMKGKC